MTKCFYDCSLTVITLEHLYSYRIEYIGIYRDCLGFHITTLHITEPPVEFTKPLEDQTVEEEATAILECELSREKADVKWFRDGQEIRKTKKYEMVSEGRIRRLIIKDCSLDDSKTYTCDAKEFKTSAFLNVERKLKNLNKAN